MRHHVVYLLSSAALVVAAMSCANILGIEPGVTNTTEQGGAGGAGATGGTDMGGSGGGLLEPSACGTLTTLQDFFLDSGADLHRRWTTSAEIPASATIDENGLNMTSVLNGAVAVTTSAGYRLQGSQIFINIDRSSAAFPGTFELSLVSLNELRRAYLTIDNNSISAHSTDGVTVSDHGSLPYALGDGPAVVGMWVVEGEIAFLAGVAEGELELIGGASTTVFPDPYVKARLHLDGTSSVSIRTVNGHLDPELNPGWCGADEIPREFGNGWDDLVTTNPCGIVRGDELALEVSMTAVDTLCVVRSTEAFDLSEQTFVVTVPQPVFGGADDTFAISLGYDEVNTALIVANDHALRLERRINNIVDDSAGPFPFNPATDAYFRLQLASGSLFVSLSADGRVWGRPESIDIAGDAKDLRLSFGVFAVANSTIEATFDVVSNAP